MNYSLFMKKILKKKKKRKKKRHHKKSIINALEQVFLYMAVEKLWGFVWILYLHKITCLVLFWLNNEIKQGLKGGIGIEENSEGYTPYL